MAAIPLATDKLYHFNVIYNHARSPLGETNDTVLSLSITRWIVESLENMGLVNSYFHDRDKRGNVALAVELTRVLTQSEMTILMLTPGFVENCLHQYAKISAFKDLLNCTPGRLVALQYGRALEQYPTLLWGLEVLCFQDNWQTDILLWSKLYSRIASILASSFYDPSIKISANKCPDYAFSDILPNDHDSIDVHDMDNRKRSRLDLSLSSTDRCGGHSWLSLEGSETVRCGISSSCDESPPSLSARSQDSLLESNSIDYFEESSEEFHFLEGHSSEATHQQSSLWQQESKLEEKTDDMFYCNPTSTRSIYQKAYERLLYLDDRLNHSSESPRSEQGSITSDEGSLENSFSISDQGEPQSEPEEIENGVKSRGKREILRTYVGTTLLQELDAVDPDYGWQNYFESRFSLERKLSDSLCRGNENRNTQTIHDYFPKHSVQSHDSKHYNLLKQGQSPRVEIRQIDASRTSNVQRYNKSVITNSSAGSVQMDSLISAPHTSHKDVLTVTGKAKDGLLEKSHWGVRKRPFDFIFGVNYGTNTHPPPHLVSRQDEELRLPSDGVKGSSCNYNIDEIHYGTPYQTDLAPDIHRTSNNPSPNIHRISNNFPPNIHRASKGYESKNGIKENYPKRQSVTSLDYHKTHVHAPSTRCFSGIEPYDNVVPETAHHKPGMSVQRATEERRHSNGKEVDPIGSIVYNGQQSDLTQNSGEEYNRHSFRPSLSHFLPIEHCGEDNVEFYTMSETRLSCQRPRNYIPEASDRGQTKLYDKNDLLQRFHHKQGSDKLQTKTGHSGDGDEPESKSQNNFVGVSENHSVSPDGRQRTMAVMKKAEKQNFSCTRQNENIDKTTLDPTELSINCTHTLLSSEKKEEFDKYRSDSKCSHETSLNAMAKINSAISSQENYKTQEANAQLDPSYDNKDILYHVDEMTETPRKDAKLEESFDGEENIIWKEPTKPKASANEVGPVSDLKNDAFKYRFHIMENNLNNLSFDINVVADIIASELEQMQESSSYDVKRPPLLIERSTENEKENDISIHSNSPPAKECLANNKQAKHDQTNELHVPTRDIHQETPKDKGEKGGSKEQRFLADDGAPKQFEIVKPETDFENKSFEFGHQGDIAPSSNAGYQILKNGDTQQRRRNMDTQQLLGNGGTQQIPRNDTQQQPGNVDTQQIPRNSDIQQIPRNVDIQQIPRNSDIQQIPRNSDIQQIPRNSDAQQILLATVSQLEASPKDSQSTIIIGANTQMTTINYDDSLEWSSKGEQTNKVNDGQQIWGGVHTACNKNNILRTEEERQVSIVEDCHKSKKKENIHQYLTVDEIQQQNISFKEGKQICQIDDTDQMSLNKDTKLAHLGSDNDQSHQAKNGQRETTGKERSLTESQQTSESNGEENISPCLNSPPDTQPYDTENKQVCPADDVCQKQTKNDTQHIRKHTNNDTLLIIEHTTCETLTVKGPTISNETLKTNQHTSNQTLNTDEHSCNHTLNTDEHTSNQTVNTEADTSNRTLNTKEHTRNQTLNTEEYTNNETLNIEELTNNKTLNTDELTNNEILSTEKLPNSETLNSEKLPNNETLNTDELTNNEILSTEKLPNNETLSTGEHTSTQTLDTEKLTCNQTHIHHTRERICNHVSTQHIEEHNSNETRAQHTREHISNEPHIQPKGEHTNNETHIHHAEEHTNNETHIQHTEEHTNSESHMLHTEEHTNNERHIHHTGEDLNNGSQNKVHKEESQVKCLTPEHLTLTQEQVEAHSLRLSRKPANDAKGNADNSTQGNTTIHVVQNLAATNDEAVTSEFLQRFMSGTGPGGQMVAMRNVVASHLADSIGADLSNCPGDGWCDLEMAANGNQSDLGMASNDGRGDLGMASNDDQGDLGMASNEGRGDLGMASNDGRGDLGMASNDGQGDLGMASNDGRGDLGMASNDGQGDLGMASNDGRGDLEMASNDSHGGLEMTSKDSEDDFGMASNDSQGDLGMVPNERKADPGILTNFGVDVVRMIPNDVACDVEMVYDEKSAEVEEVIFQKTEIQKNDAAILLNRNIIKVRNQETISIPHTMNPEKSDKETQTRDSMTTNVSLMRKNYTQYVEIYADNGRELIESSDMQGNTSCQSEIDKKTSCNVIGDPCPDSERTSDKFQEADESRKGETSSAAVIWSSTPDGQSIHRSRDTTTKESDRTESFEPLICVDSKPKLDCAFEKDIISLVSSPNDHEGLERQILMESQFIRKINPKSFCPSNLEKTQTTDEMCSNKTDCQKSALAHTPDFDTYAARHEAFEQHGNVAGQTAHGKQATEWTDAQIARKRRRGTNVDGLPSSSSSSSSSSSEEEQSDWATPCYKGLCHGLSKPEMPFLG